MTRLLRSLERLVVPESIRWEVVVVDNDSTDGTWDICEPFLKAQPERFVYVHEPRRGKSIALNTGIDAAKGDILAFTDDDCIVDESWLAAVVSEFTADPNVTVLGGRVELYDKRDKPFGIITCREKVTLKSVFSRSSPEGSLFNNVITGCNMAAKREVFRKAGNFDVFLGPGTESKSVEDLEFLYRALKNGFKVVYYPSVIVYHNHGRRTDEAVKALQNDYIRGRGAFHGKYAFADWEVAQRAFWDVYRESKRIFKGESIRESLGYLRLLMGGALVSIFDRRAE